MSNIWYQHHSKDLYIGQTSHKEIKIATKGSLQTEMNISHSNHDVIFFINFKSGTINKSRELKFSNEINKHLTMNWFSERERERN